MAIPNFGGLQGNDPTALSGTSYMPNSVVMERTLSDTRSPSQVIFIQECLVKIAYCALRPMTFPSEKGTYYFWHDNFSVGKELYSSTHFEGGNFVYCDGHADFRQRLKLRSGDFGLTPAEDTQNSTSTNPYKSAFDGLLWSDLESNLNCLIDNIHLSADASLILISFALRISAFGFISLAAPTRLAVRRRWKSDVGGSFPHSSFTSKKPSRRP
jgi:prepilin-type processing-associated H-X9-DG protein